MDDILRIYIGWDDREEEAWDICFASLQRRSSVPLHVTPLKRQALIYRGYYNRTFHLRDGQRIDDQDKKPFSTEFAFTRFLVPALENYMGWALFCDCDFLWRADVADLFALADPKYAVQVVKHEHVPLETSKMDGCQQTKYPRKNWSSLVLWNCAHPAHRALTTQAVNTRPGAWLHGFEWLTDEEIGALPMEWNWLEGWSPPSVTPKAVHYTRGGPWFADYQDVGYAKDWLRERSVVRDTRVTTLDTKYRPQTFTPRKEAADD